jgi:hypothetical protein
MGESRDDTRKVKYGRWKNWDDEDAVSNVQMARCDQLTWRLIQHNIDEFLLP